MKSCLFFALFSFLIFSSCGNITFNTATKSIKAINPNLMSNDFVVVIPHVGCTGCIGNATFFMVDHLDEINGKVAVIFTGIRDIKLLKLQIGTKFLEKPNVYIDHKNIFKEKEIASVYPQTISLKNGKITKLNIFSIEQIIAQSPELIMKLMSSS